MSCRHALFFKNEKGEQVESILYNQLYTMHNNNEDMALSAYAETKTKLFNDWLETKKDFSGVFDANGEASIESYNTFNVEGNSFRSSQVSEDEDNTIIASIIDPQNQNQTTGAKRFPAESTKSMQEILSGQQPQEALVESILNHSFSNGWEFDYYGTKFDLSKIHGDDAKREFIKEKIVPLYETFESKLKPSLVEWLNTGADLKAMNAFAFAQSSKKNSSGRYDEAVIKTLLSQMDYNPKHRYMMYSDLKGSRFENIVKFREEFEGFNPIIALHEVSQNGPQSISIYDITSLSVNKPGYKMKGKNLFTNFITNAQAEASGIDIANTEGGARMFINGLTAIAIKEANPKISIRKVTTLSVTPKNVYTVYTDIGRVLDNLKVMRGSDNFMKSFGEKIQLTLKNEVLDGLKYAQDPIAIYRSELINNYIENSEDSTEKRTKAMFALNIVDGLTKYLEGQGSKNELLEVLKHRQKVMEKSTRDFLSDTEYQNLSAAIMQLVKATTFEQNDIKPLSRYDINLKNSFDIQNDLVQHTMGLIKDDHDYITSQLRQYTVEVDKQTKRFDDTFYANPAMRVVERIGDVGGRRWLGLFKAVKDADGKLINTNEIHFDVNDDDTKKAIASGVVTRDQVGAGKWYVDQIREGFIELLLHRNKYDDTMSGLSEAESLAKAESLYYKGWKDGQIPVMTKGANEMLMQGDFKASLSRMWKGMQANENLFVDNYKPILDAPDNQVSNMFLHELDNEDVRLSRLGLERKNGQVVLIDSQLNRSISTNMEGIMKYFYLAKERKIRYDNNSLPAVNAARAVLYATSKSVGQNDKNALTALKEYADRIIHTTRQDSSLSGVMEDKINPIINTIVSITTFNGLAYSVPLAMTSMLVNNMKTMSLAFANDAANNGMFGKQEWGKAVWKFFSDSDFRNKCLKLVEFYGFDATGERELATDARFSKTKKFIWGENYAHGMNHWTDHYARSIVMAAQMLKQGSWDAHVITKDGEMEYDEKKDKRFYSNGKLTEDGKLKRDFIKQRLIQQGVMDNMEEPMKRGFDLSTARLIKTLSDKYVIGGMDATTSVALKSYTGGNLIMQFKSYLPAYIQNAIGGNMKSLALGDIDVAINPETGEKEAYVKLQAVASQVESFVSLYKSLKDNRGNIIEGWKDMKDEEKQSVTRLILNVTQFMILYGLYNGLTKDWDKEKRKKHDKRVDELRGAILQDSRFLRVFKYGALDMVSLWPTQIVHTLSHPFPALDNLERISNVVMGNTSQLKQVLPASAAITPFVEMFDQITDDK